TFEAEGCPTECKECYTDNCHNRTSVEPCDYGCESYFSDCSSKCQKCYADNCRNRTDNATDLGCDSYWQDCASKCEVGKTCVPTDCSAYTLTSCPANATCTNCTVGCGNSTKKYKLSSCNNGYEKSGNTCQACDFGDYNLDSCPNAGSCSNITCGNVKKYKLNYCTTDFQIIDNTCVRCEWGSYIAETNLNALSFDSKSQCGTTHYKIYTCESGYKLVPSGKFCTAETTGAVKITYQMEANGELGVSRISSTEYVSIDWGDGNTSYQEGYATWIYHKYSTAGVYQITINGSISKIKISPTNGYVISFEQLDLSNWKDANSQVGSAYQTSFAGDCSYATGEIPNLPPNLTNGRFMFYRCTKLTGNIPILPDTLTDGYRMFIQAYNLSGYPPAMPASLTSYDAMFTQTKVTNDGSWPSGAW
ncbi:MAG: hypothetical protein IJV97_01870, partial [Alphaproteobacteria bacterium]|nr:hypothetical protein [Alphaproteobacteria bacterium]